MRDWEAGREEAGGKRVDVRVPGLIERVLTVPVRAQPCSTGRIGASSAVIPAACRHKTGVRSHGRMQMQPCKRSFTFQWVLLDPLELSCDPAWSVPRGELCRDVILSA